MKKKYISIIVLVVVLIILAIVFKISKNTPSDDPVEIDSEQTVYTVTTTSQNDVKSIELKNIDGITDVYVLDNNTWKLENSNIKINGAILDFISDSLSNFTSTDVYEGNPSDFGITDTSPKVTVNLNDNSSYLFTVGNKTPDGKFYYIKAENTLNDGIYSVPTATGDIVMLSKSDLADKSIAQIDFETMNKIEVVQKDYQNLLLEVPKTPVDINKSAQGISTLQMVSPYKGFNVYSQNMVETILPTITTLSFDTLVDDDCEDLAIYGLDDPFLTINITSNNGSIDLLIGDAIDESYYAINRGENIVFTITKENLAPFINIDVFKFIDRFIEVVAITDVDNIVISTNDKSYTVEPNKINGIDVDEKGFSEFYTKLISIEIARALDEVFIPKDAHYTITFTLKDGKVFDSDFYLYDDNYYAYLNEESNQWFLVPRAQLNDVFDTGLDLIK